MENNQSQTSYSVWNSLQAGLIEYGFQPTQELMPYSFIDQYICNTTKCNQCGNNGFDYELFEKGSFHRAFAVCPECGNYFEF